MVVACGVVLACTSRPSPELRPLLPASVVAVERVQRGLITGRAFEQLNSATEPLSVGRICHAGAAPPAGEVAYRLLVEARRSDLLWRLVAAPSAEARVYALIGLKALAAIDSADMIHLTGNIITPVSVCNGCISWSASAAEAVALHEADETLGLWRVSAWRLAGGAFRLRWRHALRRAAREGAQLR